MPFLVCQLCVNSLFFPARSVTLLGPCAPRLPRLRQRIDRPTLCTLSHHVPVGILRAGDQGAWPHGGGAHPSDVHSPRSPACRDNTAIPSDQMAPHSRHMTALMGMRGRKASWEGMARMSGWLPAHPAPRRPAGRVHNSARLPAACHHPDHPDHPDHLLRARPPLPRGCAAPRGVCEAPTRAQSAARSPPPPPCPPAPPAVPRWPGRARLL